MIEPREFVPRDPITGQPLNFAPTEEVLNPADPNNGYHHRHHNESKRSFIPIPIEVWDATRKSSLQLTRNIDHNKDNLEDPKTATRQLSYHPTFKRTKISTSDVGQKRVLIMGAAGAVSLDVLDFPNETIRPATEAEKQRLLYSGEVKMQSEEIVARQLTQFAIDHWLAELERPAVTRYRNLKHASDQKVMIDEALEWSARTAFTLIDERYTEAMERGLLPNTVPDTPGEMAGILIFRNLGRFSMFNDALLQQAA